MKRDIFFLSPKNVEYMVFTQDVIDSMLRECKIGPQESAETTERRHTEQLKDEMQRNYKTEPIQCCGEIVTGTTAEQYPVCFKCGVVVECYAISNKPPPQHRDENSVSKLFAHKSRRFYLPLTHFTDLVRRYQGNGDVPGSIPIAQLIGEVDLNDRWLYYVIKRRLKKLHLQKYYKSIFQIIYRMGGKRIPLTHT